MGSQFPSVQGAQAHRWGLETTNTFEEVDASSCFEKKACHSKKKMRAL